MSERKKFPATLCWSCSKAIGKCNWSSDFKPVKGWKIIPTKRIDNNRLFKSCIVLECPEYDQDSIDNGLKRIGEQKCITLQPRK